MVCTWQFFGWTTSEYIAHHIRESLAWKMANFKFACCVACTVSCIMYYGVNVIIMSQALVHRKFLSSMSHSLQMCLFGVTIAYLKGRGEKGLGVDRLACHTDSMSAFFESDDLFCRLLEFITEKKHKKNFSLVCKGWKRLSETCTNWRKPFLHIVSKDGMYLKKGETRYMDASLSTIKHLLTQHQSIVQFGIYTKYHTTAWWANLATFMPHLKLLSINVPSQSEHPTKKTPFKLAGLPNLTHLDIDTDYRDDHRDGECWISSLSLSLPALHTLTVHQALYDNLVQQLREIDVVECPELGSLKVIAISMFERLESLDMFITSVSRYGGMCFGVWNLLCNIQLVASTWSLLSFCE